MVRKFKTILLTLLLVVASTQSLTISGALEQKYPSQTISGDGENTVSLTKKAEWTGNKNEAIVDILFSGLEYVKEESVPTDVIFVVDTSRSMVEAGGVVNPDHSFHLMEPYNAKLSINRDFFSDMDDLIEPFIKESNINKDLKDSVVVQVGEEWRGSTGFKYFIDPQLKIKIPHSMAISMWPNYVGIENEDIYLVPRMYSGLSEANTYLSFSALPNNVTSKVWSVVDFNKEIKADAKDPNNDFPGDSYLSYNAANIYQKDKKGNRYLESVHPMDNYTCNEDCFENYAWLPLTLKRADSQEKVKLINLDGEDAVYDKNGVPRSWYKSSKDDDGNRVGQYQRAHLLYDVIEYFVKEIDGFGSGSRYAYASFNTKSNALDINGKTVISQQAQAFTNSSNQFLESLEKTISHSGEEMYQESMSLSGKEIVSTQGTNYHSGLLAARQIMEDDPLIDSDRNRVFIFISDGQPNYVMFNPSPKGNSDSLIQDERSAGGASEIDYYHELFAHQILNDKFSNYKSYGIGLQENDSKYIKDRLSVFIDSENISVLETKDNENMELNFKRIFENIKNTSIERTKLVSIEDTIDNRYFKIDREKLEKDDQGYYPSEYSKYEIEEIMIDGIKHERITFRFEIKDMNILEQKVSIPLLKIEEADHDEFEGFIPTNYDSGESKGAKSDYIDLDGLAKKVETEKVWLATKSLVIKKVSSADGNSPLSGAEFELYYHNSDTRYNDTIYTTDSNGVIRFDLLPPGKYRLLETKAPKDHILLEEEIEIDLTINKTPETLTLEVVNEIVILPEPETQYSSVLVSKKVIDPDNKGGIEKFEFTFNVNSEKSYIYEVNGLEKGVISNGGKLVLGDGDKALIKDLEVGLGFKVTETQTALYTSNFDNNTFEGIISEEITYVEFVNTYEDEIEPEIPTDPEKPEEPGEEEVPETPEEPEKPGEEEVPETPEKPEEPGQEEGSETPEESEKPEKPGDVEVPDLPQKPSENNKEPELNEPSPEVPLNFDNDGNDGSLPNTGIKNYQNKLSYTLLIIGLGVVLISKCRKDKNI